MMYNSTISYVRPAARTETPLATATPDPRTYREGNTGFRILDLRLPPTEEMKQVKQ